LPIVDAPRTLPGYMSDTGLYGAYFLDAMETVPALAWPESVNTYHQMRLDPRLTAALAAYALPLRAGKWVVDPAGCRDEVVQLVADDFGISILGVDDAPGPARRRGIDWDEHLRLALLELVYGHMPFAMRYEILKGRARLAELSERMPSTITEIQTDKKGNLTGIVQYGEERAIPADHLLWYAHDREGANWQGRSMLRPAYGAWLLKHEMWRVIATGSRRFGAGTPVVEAPPGATSAEVEQAARLSQSIRVSDQGGAGLPNGYTAKLMGIIGSVPDTLGFVKYLDATMTEMVLASVLNLDASPNGSRALGETLIGLLEMSWSAVAKEIATQATKLSIRTVDYNWGEDEAAPKVCATQINRPEATAEAIGLMIEKGAITPDPALESWVRERYQLPEREDVPADPTIAPPAVPEPAPAPPPKPAGTSSPPPAAASLVRAGS
jgi:hypothetical protein